MYEVLDVAIYDLTWVMHEIVSGEPCTREESGIDLHLVAMQLQTIPYSDRLGSERKGSCMIKSEAANQSLFPREIGQLCCRDFKIILFAELAFTMFIGGVSSSSSLKRFVSIEKLLVFRVDFNILLRNQICLGYDRLFMGCWLGKGCSGRDCYWTMFYICVSATACLGAGGPI